MVIRGIDDALLSKTLNNTNLLNYFSCSILSSTNYNLSYVYFFSILNFENILEVTIGGNTKNCIGNLYSHQACNRKIK